MSGGEFFGLTLVGYANRHAGYGTAMYVRVGLVFSKHIPHFHLGEDLNSQRNPEEKFD